MLIHLRSASPGNMSSSSSTMNCLYDISPSLHNITQQMWAKEEQEVQNQSQSELILDVSEHNKNILRHPRSSELWFQEYYTQHLLQNDHSF